MRGYEWVAAVPAECFIFFNTDRQVNLSSTPQMVRYKARAEIVSRMYLYQCPIDVRVTLKGFDSLIPLILKWGREDVGRISDRYLDAVLEMTYCAPIRNADEPFK